MWAVANEVTLIFITEDEKDDTGWQLVFQEFFDNIIGEGEVLEVTQEEV